MKRIKLTILYHFTVCWVTASTNKDFFLFKMYMGRSEFGNETDRALAHNVDTDIDMLDDLERSKHYKTNIMQDFNDRQSGYGSRYVSLRLFLNDNVYINCLKYLFNVFASNYLRFQKPIQSTIQRINVGTWR